MATNPPQAQRLRDALKQTQLTRRRLAILLLEQQPDRTLENVRRQLNKWIQDDRTGWSDETAERLSAAFQAAGHAFPPTYFMKNPNQPPTWAEQMAEVFANQQEMEQKIRRLERKLDQMRRQSS